MSRLFPLIFLALGLLVVGGPALADHPLADVRLRDARGEQIALDESRLTVICFLGTECPLARLYAPRLSELANRFAPGGVQFLGVNSNLQDSPAEVQEYVREYGVTFPVAKDADQQIADRFGARRTPEVFVVDASGEVLYQGRIDDQYTPGQARAEPTQHDLRSAIATALVGGAISPRRTEAVGCVITRLDAEAAASADDSPVTFARDVAPILQRRCVECHRPGQIAPFSLIDYDEVVGWGGTMLEAIDAGRMPPWHADPEVGSFIGERHMPEAERRILARWIDQGMPEGDPSRVPAVAEMPAGWHLASPPDVQLVMRDRPFVVPAEGVLEYQYFVVDPGWDEDRWVRAAQVIPGDPAVVHHAIVFVRPPDGTWTRGIGWLGAFVPGQRTRPLPDGHARLVPAGSKLVFQMHYTPNGRLAEDQTRVGVWFADSDRVTHQVITPVVLDQGFEIPPGIADHAVELTASDFARDSRLLAAMPHMHLRGRSFQLDAVNAEGRRTLLRVPHYDFNWQHWYQFTEPVPLGSVDELQMTVRFDNSPGNPVNPDPSEYVHWGDQTWDEMAVAFLDIAQPRTPNDAPAERRRPQSPKEDDEQPSGVEGLVADVEADAETERRAEQFLRKMDQDGDGVVIRDETPAAFQRFGFRQFDRNGDGQLDRTEIAAAAAERR